MKAAEIEQALQNEIAVLLSKEPADLKPDQPLHTMGIDSMSFVEILLFIERTFNLRLIESGLSRQDFETIRSLALCIERELKGS
jgi:acyl carrier protein